MNIKTTAGQVLDTNKLPDDMAEIIELSEELHDVCAKYDVSCITSFVLNKGKGGLTHMTLGKHTIRAKNNKKDISPEEFMEMNNNYKQLMCIFSEYMYSQQKVKVEFTPLYGNRASDNK